MGTSETGVRGVSDVGTPGGPGGRRRGIVVTGATGIAAATARRLAAQGCRVFVIALAPSECAALVAALGGSGAGWAAADLRQEEEAVRAFDAAEVALGRIDGVVAVAGGSARQSGDGWLHEMTLDAWHAALGLNLTTTFLTAREAVRRMRASGGGSLVLTSSVLATSPQPEHFTTHGYAAAKAAISGWVRSLAAAYAAEGIRVNCVAPGLVRTPMAQRAAASPPILAFAERKQPLSAGMLSAEDVAAVMCSVLDAPSLTGQVIAVDGGWTVTSTS